MKILSGVFDPPPDRLSTPWLYLATVLVAVVVALACAGLAMLRVVRRPALEILRDL